MNNHRKALVGGLVMLCCALVVLTLIAAPTTVKMSFELLISSRAFTCVLCAS